MASNAAASSITTDPWKFYWDSSLGNEGASVVEYEGEIYWSSRANLAPTATYRYDNTGWWIQIKNTKGQSTYFYVSEAACLLSESSVKEGSTTYGYYLYKVSREILINGVEAAGYSAIDFFDGSVVVELDGNVQLINKSGSIVAGPYSLMTDSGLTTLLSKMSSYSFSSNSINVVTNELRNKILNMEGNEILLQYKITYNANGGTGAPDTQVKYYGISLSLSTKEPTKTGYEFVTWNTKSTGSGTNYQPGATVTTNQEQELYAIWKAETYTISYNSNTSDSVSNMPKSQVKTYGVQLVLDSSTPVRTGYSFVEWNTKSDGSGTSYSVKSNFNTEKETILYAIWDANPTLVVEDVYMYLDSDFDETRFFESVLALDDEDGNITELVIFQNQLEVEEYLENLKKQVVNADTEYQVELEYTVTDQAGFTVEEKSILHVYDVIENTSAVELANGGYVRFISGEYLDTLEEESVWREEEMLEYLEEILK